MMDWKDEQLITRAVERGVTEALNKFLNGVFATLSVWVGILLVVWLLFHYGGYLLGLLWVALGKH